MANRTRDDNVRRGERSVTGGKPEHDQGSAAPVERRSPARFRTGLTGSPFHTERQGAGPVKGAGELQAGQGPGRAALRVRPQMAGVPEAGAGSAGRRGTARGRKA